MADDKTNPDHINALAQENATLRAEVRTLQALVQQAQEEVRNNGRLAAVGRRAEERAACLYGGAGCRVESPMDDPCVLCLRHEAILGKHPDSWLDCDDCRALSKAGAEPYRCARWMMEHPNA